MTGKDFDAADRRLSDHLLNAILIGIGAAQPRSSAACPSINTMAMSVAERTREIGIKRAIGASRWRIRREIVIESAAIGLIAGLIGLALGARDDQLFNDLGRASGNVLFDLTLGTAFTVRRLRHGPGRASPASSRPGTPPGSTR